MLTKYTIEIDGTSTEVPKECFKNWDEIKCVYKRSEFSGVTRSYTTKFEFVGAMYDKLMALYLRDGVNAHAVLTLQTMTDAWGWEEQFSCVFDFSSITWDGYVLSLNSVDDSVAAIIKADKGTKYEAVVGDDITPDRMFAFDRLPIENRLTYAYSGGRSNDADGSLVTDTPTNSRVFMGIAGEEEVYVNRVLEWNEDQSDDADSFIIQAHKAVTVKIDIDIDSDACYPDTLTSNGGTSCRVLIYRADGTKEYKSYLSFGSHNMHYCGSYSSVEALRQDYPASSLVADGQPRKYWAEIGSQVWQVAQQGTASQVAWVNTGLSVASFRHRRVTQSNTISLAAGDKVAIETNGGKAMLYSSKFIFSWFAKGDPISVPAFTPEAVGQYILERMFAGRAYPSIEISSHDARLVKTLIVAAESIRGIPGAKLYTSFTEFAEWLETVFGYTYYLGEPKAYRFKAHRNAFGGYIMTPYTLESRPWSADHTTAPTENDIVFFGCYGKFTAYDGSKWYADFPNAADYNDPATGYARTDTVFKIKRRIGGEDIYREYYFTTGDNGTTEHEPSLYVHSLDLIGKTVQPVVFAHRSELFGSSDAPVVIDGANDIAYSVDTSRIFSSVEIGYDKKDYQNINGRDEFNFCNTYSTGCAVSDRKLTLKSKYRADCYGIEFAAQKRCSDTTDTASDKDVFFVYCKEGSGGVWIPDTSMTIDNARSDDVFNRVFSPMACVQANAGYISMQGNPLTLAFASSEGNSDIVIGTQAVSADIVLSSPLLTCGELQFSCSGIDGTFNSDALYEVVSGGVTYRGYVQEVSFKYAKAETVKYKLIVKEVVR